MTIKTITLGVSGSISAYKSADLANQLTKKGYDVHVLMTKSASQFITPLTFQSLTKNPVHLEVMQENNPKVINHIELAKKTDLFILAPASTNTIARLSYGFADDIITAVAIALPQSTPKILAPAMNTNMYLNPLTQENIKRLKDFLDYRVIQPKSSLLACGDHGIGALAEISDMIEMIEKVIH